MAITAGTKARNADDPGANTTRLPGERHSAGSSRSVAEHGKKAGYVQNITQNPSVRVKLRDGLTSRLHTGTAYLLDDDNPRTRQRRLAEQVRGSASNAAAVRFFGTDLLTICVDLDD